MTNKNMRLRDFHKSKVTNEIYSSITKDFGAKLALSIDDIDIKLAGDNLKEFLWLMRCKRPGKEVNYFLERLIETAKSVDK